MSNLLPPVSEVFVVVAKKAFQRVWNETDELLISNWGALRLALDALNKEDASDFVRSGQLWSQAKGFLVSEEENAVGAGAQGPLAMQDDFSMEQIPYGL